MLPQCSFPTGCLRFATGIRIRRAQGARDGVAVAAATLQNTRFPRNFRRRHAYSEASLYGETTWFGLLRVVFIDFGTLSFDLVGQNFYTSARRGAAAGRPYLLTFPHIPTLRDMYFTQISP